MKTKNYWICLISIMLWYSTVGWGPGSDRYLLLPLAPFIISWILLGASLEKRRRIIYSMLLAYTIALLAFIPKSIFHSGADFGKGYLLCSIGWHTLPVFAVVTWFFRENVKPKIITKYFVLVCVSALIASFFEYLVNREVWHAIRLTQEFGNYEYMDWRATIVGKAIYFPLGNMFFWGTNLYFLKKFDRKRKTEYI